MIACRLGSIGCCTFWLALALAPALADVRLEELPESMPARQIGVREVVDQDGVVVQISDLGEAPCLPPGVAIYGEPWTWQPLPDGLIYHSYLAGPKEPRLASVWQHTQGQGSFWDFTIGGRVGLLRYGTQNNVRPEGWQLDAEAAAFPRLTLDSVRDLEAVDFRGGFPLTYGRGPVQLKLAYVHQSSHIGDEFLVRNPTFQRINYSRDAIVLGVGYYLGDDVRVYGETGYGFYVDGGAGPWEFQFGAEYSPLYAPGFRGSPFAAINGHLRQEVDFGGSLVIQGGWQWRSLGTGRRFRFGGQYFNGKSEQYQFFRSFEQQLGLAVWYDY